MAKNTQTDLGELAAIASLGGGLDPEMKALLMEELRDKIEARKEEKAQTLAWRKANAEAVGEARAAQKAEQSLCPHRKENNETALAGQHIGNGVLCFVCLKCNAEFHRPAKIKGQQEPPLALIPTSGVGGPAFS